MSGLTGTVKLEARQGKIIISKSDSPRQGWTEQIRALTAAVGQTAQEFDDMKSAAHDGLDDLSWEGPTFEEWQKANETVS